MQILSLCLTVLGSFTKTFQFFYLFTFWKSNGLVLCHICCTDILLFEVDLLTREPLQWLIL